MLSHVKYTWDFQGLVLKNAKHLINTFSKYWHVEIILWIQVFPLPYPRGGGEYIPRPPMDA